MTCTTSCRSTTSPSRSARVRGPASPVNRSAPSSHRDRRPGPRPGDGVRGPSPPRTAWSAVSSATSTDRRRHDAGAGLDPATTLFIVSEQDLRHPQDPDQRPPVQGVAAGRLAWQRRRPGRRETLRRGLDRARQGRRLRDRPRTTPSASGTGSVAATRWTPRSAPSLVVAIQVRTGSVTSWPASTRWTSTSSTAPLDRNVPVLMGLLNVWYANFPAPRPTPCCRTPSCCTGSRRTSAADDGVQRQGRPVGRERRHDRHRRGVLGRARHQRSARVLPADPPGHPAHPGGLHRVRRAGVPPPGRPRRPDRRRPRAVPRQLLRPDQGAGVRQDRRRGACGGYARQIVPARCSPATGPPPRSWRRG